MDSSLQSQSPDNSDAKPSFRKPANDATNRKYRRRSPISGSPSSSSGGKSLCCVSACVRACVCVFSFIPLIPLMSGGPWLLFVGHVNWVSHVKFT